MFSDKEALKEKARQLFDDGMAAAIAEQIESDVSEEAAALPPAVRPSGGVPWSLATLFFADRFYSKLKVGKFSGRLTVAWNGMDSFVFIPDPVRPFTYTTSDGRTIRPGVMETDGGSIPRLLRGLQKFSSWGYAPAFIIHDWLFVAKKCKLPPDEDWGFAKTADIMAEAIKTLMEVGYQDYEERTFRLEKAEDTVYVMHKAVMTSIARRIWDDNNGVRCLT